MTSSTNAPELQSVKVGEESGSNTAVKFTFDEDVASSADKDSFQLVDWAGTSVKAQSAQKDKDDPKSIWAVFTTDEVKGAVAAVAAADAVSDLDAHKNVPGSVPLNSVTVEGTSLPDLIKVTNPKGLGTADATVDFVFDKKVGAQGTDAAISFVRSNGDIYTVADDLSTAAETVKTNKTDDTLRVNISGLTKTQYDSFRRVAVVELSDANQALQSLDLSSDGSTDGPEISKIDVNRDKNYADVTFDTPVEVSTNGALSFTDTEGALQTSDGGVAVKGSNTTIRYTFTTLNTGDDINVYATLADDSVKSKTTGKSNGVDGQAYTYTLKAGDTAGPNVTSAALAVSKGAFGKTVITLTFDEIVDDADDLEVVGYTEEGTAVDLTTSATQEIVLKDSEETNQVTLTFLGGNATDKAVKESLEDKDIKVISLNGEKVIDVHSYFGYETSTVLK